MSQKWFNNIDLQQNELQNGVIQNLAGNPSNGKAGQIYYNTVDKGYRYYNGSAWVSITEEAVKSIKAGNGLTSTGTDTVTISLGDPSASGYSGSDANTYGSNSVTENSHTHQISLPDATETVKGVIELATDDEATEGIDTTRAINAKQLATAKQDVIRDVMVHVVNSAKVTIRTSNGITGGSETAASSFTLSGVDASATEKGVVQLATQEEVNTGTNTAKVITSATLGKGKANGVASLDNSGKIVTSQLPDYLLGQVMYGGNASAISTTTTVSPSDSLKAKKGTTATSISIVNSATSTVTNTYGWQDMEGVYFICQANGTFAGIDFETGDWIISTGSAWEKIDNTDSIVNYSQKSVQTFTGDGKQTIFDFTHSFGSDVVVQVYLTGQTVGSDSVDELIMVATHTLNNKVKLVFATAPTASQTFKVVIVG